MFMRGPVLGWQEFRDCLGKSPQSRQFVPIMAAQIVGWHCCRLLSCLLNQGRGCAVSPLRPSFSSGGPALYQQLICHRPVTLFLR